MPVDNIILNRNIKGYLLLLSDNVAKNNALGLFDINKNSEDLVAQLLNKVFNFALKNANEEKQNFPAIDLIDTENKIAVQVSSTTDGKKIINTSQKFINHNHYNSFERLIIYFLTNKNPNFTNPTRSQVNYILSNYIHFNFQDDIFNNVTIGNSIDKIIDSSILNDIEFFLAERLALPNGGRMDPIRGYILPKRLNAYAGYSISELVGRQNTLEEINTIFQNSNIILLTGLGGIGKTTVARAYLETYQNQFSHVAYVNVSSSITESILQRLSNIDKSFDYNPNLSSLDNLQNLIHKVRTIYNTILVLDNCDNEKELRELKPIIESLGWKVLITTRTRPANYLNEIIEITSLQPSDALTLFTSYYNPNNEDEIELIKQIISKAYYHTKVIILLAKAASNNPLLELKELGDKVTLNEYHAEAIDIIVDLNQEEQSVYEFILALFKPESLSGYVKHYIRLFSVLPNQEIPIDHLFELFEGENSDKQKYLLNTLRTLVNEGWIEKYSNNYYRIHPLVQLVTQRKLNPKPVDVYVLIDNLLNLFDNILDPVIMNTYIPYCESIVKYFHDQQDGNIGKLLNKMSWIYRELANFNSSIDSNFRALKIFESLPDNFFDAKAQTYGYLMTTYTQLTRYDEALYFGELCVNLQEKILPPTHPDLLATYSNLANLLRNVYRHDTALIYVNKMISHLKIIYLNDFNNIDAFNLFNGYTTRAAIVADQGNFSQNEEDLKRALRSDFRALIIARRILSSDNKRLATLYSNISLTYRDLRCFDKALEYLDKAIEIQERILSYNHPDLGLSYYNKGRLFGRMNQLHNGIVYAHKALVILEHNYPLDHQNVIGTKELIAKLENPNSSNLDLI